MHAVLKSAILGFAVMAASASAQNVTEPTLVEANIVKPEHPTRDGQLHIGFVYFGPDNAPRLKVAQASVRVSALANSETLTLDDDSVKVEPACPGSTGPWLEVTPDGRCRILVSLNNLQAPGLYTAKVSLVGKGGGQQEVKLDFARRGPLWWAIVLVVLGLAAGLIVTAWRGGGRDRTRAAIAIKEAVEELERLDNTTGLPPRMSPILTRALQIEAAVLRALPYDAAEILEVQRRVPEYRFLRVIEAQASGLTPEEQQELAVPIDTALEAMYPTPGGTLAAVPPALLVAVRDKLKEIKARPVSSLSDNSDQPIPGELIPLPITLRMSSGTARLAYAIAEWGVAFVLMLVFAAAAIGTLYYGKTYWGSYGDLLAAFMVGFGACAGAVAGVDSFLQRARTVPTFP